MANRDKLIEALADGWRVAENIYLHYDDDEVKQQMKEIQDACKLTDDEIEELTDQCEALAV